MIGFAMIVALILIAIFHNQIAPYPARPAKGAFDPLYAGESGQPPSWLIYPFGDPNFLKHPFGTTIMGTDVFSEIVHGTIYTVIVAISVTLITMIIVAMVGIVSGYFGRYVDDVLMRITEIFLVFPSLMLILVFARIFQLRVNEPYVNLFGISVPIGLTIVIVILSIFGWAGYARVIRGEVMKVNEAEFVLAEKSLGASSRWIMFRHIFPNVLPQIIVLATLTMAGAVLGEAAVSFLGFGDPNTITWGLLMQESLQDYSTTWWAEVFPGLAVFLAVLGFNLIGDALSDAMNPRLRE